jgi:hypothetical protein
MSSTRVFWPRVGLRRDEGLVLGLRVEDIVVVVTIVENGVSLKWRCKLILAGRPGTSVSQLDDCRIGTKHNFIGLE